MLAKCLLGHFSFCYDATGSLPFFVKLCNIFKRWSYVESKTFETDGQPNEHVRISAMKQCRCGNSGVTQCHCSTLCDNSATSSAVSQCHCGKPSVTRFIATEMSLLSELLM